jgi:septal ring factor EnvC (AmiA/AmiB activator)
MRCGVLAAPLLAGLLASLPAAAVDREGDLERVRAAIAESRERVTTYEREERGLLDAIDAIDQTAELLKRDVERARAAAATARAALARAEADAVGVAERLAATERAMSRRAVALYRVGELGALPMLFSAGDLRQFLTRVQALRRLLSHDAQLLERHHAQSRALEETRRRAAKAARDSELAEATLAERSDQLRAERKRKRVLAAQLRSSRTRERSALIELETAGRALEETVAALPAEPPPSTAPTGPAFASLHGRLAPPVEAPVARGFGRVVDDEFLTETFRKGVEFDVAEGTPVRSVAGGQVRYAGRFRGYGNTVILDHGDEYFTVSAHLAEIDVAVGDAVRPGQVVGLVGESGSLSGPHLYFELRRGREPLDPGAWLAPLGTSRPKR